MAVKYIVRNGVKIPADKANQIAVLRMKGYTNAQIAQMMNLTECQVVNLLSVNRD